MGYFISPLQKKDVYEVTIRLEWPKIYSTHKTYISKNVIT